MCNDVKVARIKEKEIENTSQVFMEIFTSQNLI